MKLLEWIKDLYTAIDQILSEWVNSYCLFSKREIEAEILNFHDTVNDFQTAAYQVKKDKSSWLMKDSFELSFADKDVKSEQSKEKAMSWKNKKKKSKTNKELTEDVDFSTEWEYILKRAVSSSRDHLDDSRSRSRTFKRW